MKRIYAALAIIGAIVPNAFIGMIIIQQGGFDWGTFLQGPFTNIGAQFLTIDLLLSMLVFWVFVYAELKKQRIPYWWIAIVGNFLIGVCFAFPMFLYLRERALEQQQH